MSLEGVLDDVFLGFEIQSHDAANEDVSSISDDSKGPNCVPDLENFVGASNQAGVTDLVNWYVVSLVVIQEIDTDMELGILENHGEKKQSLR